jgi:hypothetical protein
MLLLWLLTAAGGDGVVALRACAGANRQWCVVHSGSGSSMLRSKTEQHNVPAVAVWSWSCVIP